LGNGMSGLMGQECVDGGIDGLFCSFVYLYRNM